MYETMYVRMRRSQIILQVWKFSYFNFFYSSELCKIRHFYYVLWWIEYHWNSINYCALLLSTQKKQKSTKKYFLYLAHTVYIVSVQLMSEASTAAATVVGHQAMTMMTTTTNNYDDNDNNNEEVNINDDNDDDNSNNNKAGESLENFVWRPATVPGSRALWYR